MSAPDTRPTCPHPSAQPSEAWKRRIRTSASAMFSGPAPSDSRTALPPLIGSKSAPGARATPSASSRPAPPEASAWAQDVVDAEVHVERPVGRGHVPPAQVVHRVEHVLARGREPCDRRIALRVGLVREGFEACVLRGHRRAQRQVPGDRVAGGDQVLRQDRPAQPPPRHPPVLREGGDDDCVVTALQRRGPVRVRERHTVVDLVGDEPHTVGLAPRGERGELRLLDHRAGGVRGRGEHEALERGLAVRGLQHLHRRLEPDVRAAGQLDDLDVLRPEDVRVRGVAGGGERDPVACVEAREEHHVEGTGRSAGHGDALDRDVDVVPALVVLSDPLPQRDDPEHLRIAQAGPVEHDLGGSAADACGRALGRLTHAE